MNKDKKRIIVLVIFLLGIFMTVLAGDTIPLSIAPINNTYSTKGTEATIKSMPKLVLRCCGLCALCAISVI
jgi:hypothetical protein